MAELKIIFWEAGHGGSDPGAVGYVKEAPQAIKVTNYGCAYLEDNYQCEVYKDITADSINTVVARANEWKADLFMSTHFNAGGGDGYEGLVYSEKNKDLGKHFEKYVKAIGQNSRGVKVRPDLGVLRLTNMQAILHECAFVDTKKDIQDWDEDHELKVMGEALAKAAADWLDLPKKKKAASSTKTNSTKKTAVASQKKATESAADHLKSLAGTYKVTAKGGLNVRDGAGEKKKKLVAIPKGTKVECYGYYTAVSGVKWLYVQVTYKKVTYTGFCSSKYLKKV